MLTLRLHLDDCGAENGALRVIPGSRQDGFFGGDSIRRWKEKGREVTCAVARVGILAMRPLLAHASPAAARPGQRRVVHLEFAAEELPGELEWKWRG